MKRMKENSCLSGNEKNRSQLGRHFIDSINSLRMHWIRPNTSRVIDRKPKKSD
jgi:hypothetical protein